MKKLVSFMVAAVFLGAQILALDVGLMKLSMYRVSLILLIVALFIGFVRNDQQIKFYTNHISFQYVIFYGIWLSYGIVSILWASNIGGWLKANFFIACGFLSIFSIYTFIKEKKDIWRLFQIVSGALCLHNIIGWSEILTGKYMFADLEKLDKYGTFGSQPMTRIPISIYANQNDYATFLLAGIFFTIILLKTTKSPKMKISYGLLIASSLYLMIRTESRANQLALCIGIGLIVIVKLNEVISRKQIMGLIGTVMISGVFGVLFIPFIQTLAKKILLLLFDTSNIYGSSNETRLNLIRNGFVFLSKTFGFGVGAGNIEYWMEHNATFNISTKYNMHNWWMEILTAYGLYVFIAYVFIFILIIVQLYRFYSSHKDSQIKIASLILMGYLSAFILSSISSATNIIIEWQWIIFGVVIGFIGFVERGMSKEASKIKINKKMTLERYIGG